MRAAPARKLRILLVDEHEGVRATTAASLADISHDVVETRGAEAALAELARSTEYALLVIGDAMPQKSGDRTDRTG